MWVNNETGVIQDVARLGQACREPRVLFHVDGVQAAGKLPMAVAELPIDSLALSSHKLHGPKGAGALYVRRGVPFEPLLTGGPQEGERRAGTENVPGIVGLGRAAELALGALGVPGGLDLRLTKRVPSRAGLGAGSSDAAAALLACETLYERKLSEEGAKQLLASLGSDCVFFRAAARSGFARCTGRGERVEALEGPQLDWHAVVLVPDLGASTPEVYAALGTPLSAPPANPTVRPRALQLGEAALRGMLTNGLERAALRAVPGLAPWRDLLDDLALAHFRLSGSGSSFFGLFRDPQEARSCLVDLENETRVRALAPRALLTTRLSGRGAALV